LIRIEKLDESSMNNIVLMKLFAGSLSKFLGIIEKQSIRHNTHRVI